MVRAQGLGSGLDVGSIVSQLVAAEGGPATQRLALREASFQAELSGLGTFRSALSTFRDALTALEDVDVFRSRTASSGDDDVFTASASTDAAEGTFDIEVLALASAQKLATEAVSDPDTTSFGSGELRFQLGDDTSTTFTVEIKEDNATLADIRDAINSARVDSTESADANENTAIRASLINTDEGTRLVITSTETGVANQINITALAGDYGFLTAGSGASGSTLTETQPAADARIRIDGFESSSTTNRFRDIADGIDINVKKAEPGTVNTLEVSNNEGNSIAKANEFVSAYNDLLDTISSLTSFDEATGAQGSLFGDATVRQLASTLRTAVAGGGRASDGSFRSLTRAGITTSLDGKLSINLSDINEALDTDFESIARLFGGEDGFATRLSEIVEPFVRTGGQLDDRTEGLQSSIDLIADQRDALNVRLESVERRLLAEFTALDTTIAGLTATSDFLATQLSAVPTSS